MFLLVIAILFRNQCLNEHFSSFPDYINEGWNQFRCWRNTLLNLFPLVEQQTFFLLFCSYDLYVFSKINISVLRNSENFEKIHIYLIKK